MDIITTAAVQTNKWVWLCVYGVFGFLKRKQITKFLWHFILGFKCVYHAIRLIRLDIAAVFVRHRYALLHTLQRRKKIQLNYLLCQMNGSPMSRMLLMPVIQNWNFINNTDYSNNNCYLTYLNWTAIFEIFFFRSKKPQHFCIYVK